MRLEFRLLVIDDNPTSIESAIRGLRAHLEAVGFVLKQTHAPDLSERGIRDLARHEGKNFDLVIVDFNLGGAGTDGAIAAARVRQELPYTDIIFYSSDPTADLLSQLASKRVAGVFVANRLNLDDELKGIADTVIKKVVDLCHMRGAAMAEVADMDVLIEEVLERAFSSANGKFQELAKRTLDELLESAHQRVADFQPLVRDALILEVILDSRLFGSMDRFKALRRLARLLPEQPTTAIQTLSTYDTDVLKNRNTLAHAREEESQDGTIHLRSIKRGQPPVVIDDAWMTDFRGKLLTHRSALVEVCAALVSHIDGLEPESR